MNIYRKILSNKNFKFKTIKNIGKKSIIELNKLEEEILENIQLISLFKDDKTLEKLCEEMNKTEIKFPDTNFVIFYKLVSS